MRLPKRLLFNHLKNYGRRVLGLIGEGTTVVHDTYLLPALELELGHASDCL